MNASDLVLLSRAFVPQFGAAIPFRSLLEYAIYIGVLMIITTMVVLWIVIGRAPQELSDRDARRRSTRGRSTKWPGKNDTNKATNDRRRRRSQRRRNPTLAETGGLPPIRNESSSADSYQN